ncbi:MAG TPA: hypothetical protein VF884_16200 [Nitrososphaeraceae archaeon]
MSEREVIVHLIGEYETCLRNAAQWRIDIQGLLKNQNDRRFIETIIKRLDGATDNFRGSIEH